MKIGKISSQDRVQTLQDTESINSNDSVRINSARDQSTKTPKGNIIIDKEYGKPNKNYFNSTKEKLYQFFDKLKN